MTVRDFSTFCHISEYGEDGYAALHRMMAVSHPLNLWSPSSQLLRSPRCRVTPEQFVHAVAAGHVRIVGRTEWLTDRDRRDKHPWAGARWDPYVDDAIHGILKEDSAVPDHRARRVVAVGPELGFERADEDLARDPSLGRRWARILNGRTADRHVPAATLQRARREATVTDAVRVVLRDAHNHGRAIVEADARVPFLLHRADRNFLSLLAKERADAQREAVTVWPEADPRVADRLATAAEQLIDFLAHLDLRRVDDRPFVGTEGHELLVAWFAAVCDHIRSTGPSDAAGAVLGELRGQFGDSTFAGLDLRDLVRSRWGAIAITTAMADPALGLAGVLQHPTDLLGLGGLAAGAIATGAGLLQHMGLIPGGFTGPQWPFLYCYGKPATKRLLGSLRSLLDDLDLAHRNTQRG